MLDWIIRIIVRRRQRKRLLASPWYQGVKAIHDAVSKVFGDGYTLAEIAALIKQGGQHLMSTHDNPTHNLNHLWTTNLDRDGEYVIRLGIMRYVRTNIMSIYFFEATGDDQYRRLALTELPLDHEGIQKQLNFRFV